MNFLKWFKKKSFNGAQKSSGDILQRKISELQDILGYEITNSEYYLKALTHRSYLEITEELSKSNERLEFLGDSVLGLVVSEFLFDKFSDGDEGYLTKTRSQFVNRINLAKTASRIELESVILYNKKFIGIDDHGLRTILADALEALIGAIYLDKGLADARKFIHRNIISPNLRSGAYEIDNNFKGQLLEFSHSHKILPPVYRLVKAVGPEHSKTFTIEVIFKDEVIGRGVGKNKKSAEQKAAEDALNKLRGEYE